MDTLTFTAYTHETLLRSIVPVTSLLIEAKLDGVQVGYCEGWLYKPRVMLEQVMVVEDCQGLGIGTELINLFAKKAAQKGCNWLLLEVREDNPRAKALYERLGFTVYKESMWPDGTPVFEMQKNI